MQDAQEHASNEPGEERDHALDEDSEEEDRAIEEERERSSVLEPLEMLLSNEASDRDGGERP